MVEDSKLVVAATLIAAMALATGFRQAGQLSNSEASSDDLSPVQLDGKWGYADKNGKIAIKPQFSEAHRFSNNLALVSVGGLPLADPVVKSFVKMGYINTNGHWVIQSRFEYFFFDDFSEGLVPFRKNFGRWGYMDTTGKIAIRPQFSWAGNFSRGIAPVLLENTCAHIDKAGKVTDRSQTLVPRKNHEQDRRGTYQFRPHLPPCS